MQSANRWVPGLTAVQSQTFLQFGVEITAAEDLRRFVYEGLVIRDVNGVLGLTRRGHVVQDYLRAA